MHLCVYVYVLIYNTQTLYLYCFKISYTLSIPCLAVSNLNILYDFWFLELASAHDKTCACFFVYLCCYSHRFAGNCAYCKPKIFIGAHHRCLGFHFWKCTFSTSCFSKPCAKNASGLAFDTHSALSCLSLATTPSNRPGTRGRCVCYYSRRGPCHAFPRS